MKPYIFALLTAGIWGVAPVLEKLGLARMEPASAILIRVTGVIFGALVLIIFRIQILKQALLADTKTFLLLFCGGLLASFVGQIFFYRALKEGEASQIVPLAATYPLISFLLGLIFLQEKLTLAKGIGVFLVISGVMLLK